MLMFESNNLIEVSKCNLEYSQSRFTLFVHLEYQTLGRKQLIEIVSYLYILNEDKCAPLLNIMSFLNFYQNIYNKTSS